MEISDFLIFTNKSSMCPKVKYGPWLHALTLLCLSLSRLLVSFSFFSLEIFGLFLFWSRKFIQKMNRHSRLHPFVFLLLYLHSTLFFPLSLLLHYSLVLFGKIFFKSLLYAQITFPSKKFEQVQHSYQLLNFYLGKESLFFSLFYLVAVLLLSLSILIFILVLFLSFSHCSNSSKKLSRHLSIFSIQISNSSTWVSFAFYFATTLDNNMHIQTLQVN